MAIYHQLSGYEKRSNQALHVSPNERKEAVFKCLKVLQAQSFLNGKKGKSLIKLNPTKDGEGLLIEKLDSY